MPLHGLGIAARQDEGGTDPTCRTDGAKYVGRLGALVLRRPGPGAAFRPASCNLVLLTDPGLVLPPEFYFGVGWEFILDFRHTGGEVFLKSASSNSFWAW